MFIAAILLIATPIVHLAKGDTLNSDTLAQAIQLAFTALVAWAIARELDPDFNFTAYLAAPAAILAALIWEPPTILALVGVMITTRIVNRTVGPPFTLIDAAALICFAGLLAYLGYPIVGLGLTVGIAANHVLPNPDRPLALMVATLALISTTIGTLTLLPVTVEWGIKLPILLALISISLLYRYALERTPNPPTSHTDIGKKPLAHPRIIAAQYLAFLITISTAAVFGKDGLLSLSALWACFLAMGLRAIYQQFPFRP
jgi:hypothetical protein